MHFCDPGQYYDGGFANRAGGADSKDYNVETKCTACGGWVRGERRKDEVHTGVPRGAKGKRRKDGVHTMQSRGNSTTKAYARRARRGSTHHFKTLTRDAQRAGRGEKTNPEQTQCIVACGAGKGQRCGHGVHTVRGGVNPKRRGHGMHWQRWQCRLHGGLETKRLQIGMHHLRRGAVLRQGGLQGVRRQIFFHT